MRTGISWTRLWYAILCKIGIHGWIRDYDGTYAACLRCGAIKMEPRK